MENMNELLERYFNGESSLQEENQLKIYFKSSNVDPEHEMYRPLFVVFESESEISYHSDRPADLKIKTHKVSNFWLKSISLTGIAASLVLAVWLFGNNAATTDYAVVNGKRINDAAYAQQLAVSKINKVNKMLAKNMQPLNSIRIVKKNLEPVDKISDIRYGFDQMRNKLNFKQ